MSTLRCCVCGGSIFDCFGCPEQLTARPSRRGEVVATLDRGVTVETGRQVSAQATDDDVVELLDPGAFIDPDDAT